MKSPFFPPTPLHLSSAQLRGVRYTATRLRSQGQPRPSPTIRARISRPAFVLPSSSFLGYRVGTEHRANQGSSQPEGTALEEEEPDCDPPCEHSYDSRKPGRDQRGLPGGNDANRAGLERAGGEGGLQKEWGCQISPEEGSSHSTETHATSDSPGLLATCDPFHLCPHYGHPHHRAQARLCPLPVFGAGLGRFCEAVGWTPGSKGGPSGMQDWAGQVSICCEP